MPSTSGVVEYEISRSRMISPANGQSISTAVLGPSTRMSTCQNSPSNTLYLSSTSLPTVRSVRSSIPSTTRVVLDVHMARLSSRSGRILTSPLYPHKRWALVPDMLRSMITGVVGTGEKFLDWVSARLCYYVGQHPHVDPRVISENKPCEST